VSIFFIKLYIITDFGPPQSLNATAISESTIIVTWEKPNGAEACGIYYYKFTYGTNGYQTHGEAFDQDLILSSLTSNSRYQINVAAVGYDGLEGDLASTEETTRE